MCMLIVVSEVGQFNICKTIIFGPVLFLFSILYTAYLSEISRTITDNAISRTMYLIFKYSFIYLEKMREGVTQCHFNDIVYCSHLFLATDIISYSFTNLNIKLRCVFQKNCKYKKGFFYFNL